MCLEEGNISVGKCAQEWCPLIFHSTCIKVKCIANVDSVLVDHSISYLFSQNFKSARFFVCQKKYKRS